MRWLSHLKKPAKIFIIIMMFVVFLFFAIIIYLEATNNSMFESMSHYFVGDTESEITVDEVISYGKKEVKDENLDEGVTKTRQEGKNGKKKIIFRVTKDKDGNEINRTFIREEIVTEAVDEIIVIGTKAPAPANNGYSQGGWSNNNGSQPSSGGGGSNSGSQSSSGDSGSNSGPQSSTNNGGSNSNSNQGGDAGSSAIYYCASNPQNVIVGWEPVGDGSAGRNVWEWQVYYIKTNRPCSELQKKLSRYLFDITSGDFYSQTDIKPNYGSVEYFIETRILHCGKTDPHENVCRPYVIN